MFKLPTNYLSSVPLLGFVLTCAVVAFNLQFVSTTVALLERHIESFGFIDKTGHVVIDLRRINQNTASRCDFLPISDGFSLVNMCVVDPHNIGFLKAKWMFLGLNGTFIGGNKTFEGAHDFSEGLAAVDLMHQEPCPSSLGRMRFHLPEGDWYFIDKEGVIRFGSFAEVQDFSEGLAAVRKKNSDYWYFVDKKGNKAISGPYTAVGSFSQGRAAVCINGKWGLISRDGKFVVEPVYERQIRPFRSGLAAIELPSDNRVDYLNATGTIVLSVDRSLSLHRRFIWCDHERGGGFTLVKGGGSSVSEVSTANSDVSEDLVVIERNGKFGYADLVGRTVIPASFDYCWPFSEGRGRVFQQGLAKGFFGYVDRTGHEVVSCKLDEASDFVDGAALVKQSNSERYEYIDYSGNNVFGKTYRVATPFHEGFALIGQP